MARRATARQPAAAIPPAEPDDASHSGRLLLRMPQTLHAELARAAEEEGVSLNAFITSALAGAVDWRSRPDASRPGTSRGRDVLVRMLIADAVLVALAVALAIALLIVAWL
jgi:hypothetical protein